MLGCWFKIFQMKRAKSCWLKQAQDLVLIGDSQPAIHAVT
jgi:hypothetical protein